ncbi:MAG TPA: ribbon-helix-helix protein, CopG family [Candidatus Acidoferrum sp.]|nr:ribbon-helix-helix protein, CopG family [Candidatus Acidoferrum sp.]
MPTTVRLDPQTLSLMNRLAKRTGRTKSDLIRDAIRHLGAVEGTGNAYDVMEHRLGCWDSGGARLSERTGRTFTAVLLARQGKKRKSSRR